MTQPCAHCGGYHETGTHFCPKTGIAANLAQPYTPTFLNPQSSAEQSADAGEAPKLFHHFLCAAEVLKQTYYLGRVGILKPARTWIGVTNRRVLGLAMTHYFFQDAPDGAKILHSFRLPIHHLNFEEPSTLELVFALLAAVVLSFFTLGFSLLLFLVWWVRVYRRKGFMVDGHVFLCSGQKEAAWAAMKTIAESSDEWRQ